MAIDHNTTTLPSPWCHSQTRYMHTPGPGIRPAAPPAGHYENSERVVTLCVVTTCTCIRTKLKVDSGDWLTKHETVGQWSHTLAVGTSLIWTPLGPKKVPLLVRCPDFKGYLYKQGVWNSKMCPDYREVFIKDILIRGPMHLTPLPQ